MLFREIIAAHFKHRVKHIHTFRWNPAEILKAEARAAVSYHYDLKN